MASVAVGSFDAYYEFGLHAWDMAAGALLIQEAGGTVIDTTGMFSIVLSFVFIDLGIKKANYCFFRWSI